MHNIKKQVEAYSRSFFTVYNFPDFLLFLLYLPIKLFTYITLKIEEL